MDRPTTTWWKYFDCLINFTSLQCVVQTAVAARIALQRSAQQPPEPPGHAETTHCSSVSCSPTAATSLQSWLGPGDELFTVMTSSPAVSPPPPSTISESLALSAVANMKRLLEAYRSLAPLTIGGPSSTSLETNQSPSPLPGRPLSDPRMMKKFAPYHFLMGPMVPPGGPGGLHSQPTPPHSMWSSSSGSGGRLTGSDSKAGRASPAPPIFSPRDKESSRLRLWLWLLTAEWHQSTPHPSNIRLELHNILYLQSLQSLHCGGILGIAI